MRYRGHWRAWSSGGAGRAQVPASVQPWPRFWGWTLARPRPNREAASCPNAVRSKSAAEIPGAGLAKFRKRAAANSGLASRGGAGAALGPPAREVGPHRPPARAPPAEPFRRRGPPPLSRDPIREERLRNRRGCVPAGSGTSATGWALQSREASRLKFRNREAALPFRSLRTFQKLKPGVPRFGASGLPGREFPVHLSGKARPAARAAGPPIPEEGCPEIGGANSRKRIASNSGIGVLGGAAARLFGRPSGGPGPRRAARMSPTANFPPRPPARAIPDGLSPAGAGRRPGSREFQVRTARAPTALKPSKNSPAALNCLRFSCGFAPHNPYFFRFSPKQFHRRHHEFGISEQPFHQS